MVREQEVMVFDEEDFLVAERPLPAFINRHLRIVGLEDKPTLLNIPSSFFNHVPGVDPQLVRARSQPPPSPSSRFSALTTKSGGARRSS